MPSAKKKLSSNAPVFILHKESIILSSDSNSRLRTYQQAKAQEAERIISSPMTNLSIIDQ